MSEQLGPRERHIRLGRRPRARLLDGRPLGQAPARPLGQAPARPLGQAPARPLIDQVFSTSRTGLGPSVRTGATR